MNRDLNAQAFTHKQDVYFGAGKAPAKDALTAYKLTYVVQQRPINKAVVSRLPDIQLDEAPLQKVTRLDQEIAQGIKGGDWEMAAKALDQYSMEDIRKTLRNFQGKKITPVQKNGIHLGAINAGLDPHSNAAKETSLVFGLPKDRVADVEKKWLSNNHGETVVEAAKVPSEAGKIDLKKTGGIAYDENSSTDTKTQKKYTVIVAFTYTDLPIINVYPQSFNKNFSWLFSVILHEYQHVLQLTNSPESVVPGRNKESSAQQEVEAWASQLINAEKTGIIANPTKIQECWNMLTTFWNVLMSEQKKPLQGLYSKARKVATKVLGKL